MRLKSGLDFKKTWIYSPSRPQQEQNEAHNSQSNFHSLTSLLKGLDLDPTSLTRSFKHCYTL